MHLPKDGVLLVQAVQLISKGDVELRRVEVGPRGRHTHGAALLVLQVWPDLIVKAACLLAVQRPANKSVMYCPS